MNQENNQLSAIEMYRQIIKDNPLSFTDVTAPSGMVFKFRKPNLLAQIISDGELPGAAAGEAIEAWKESGLNIPTVSTIEKDEEDEEQKSRKKLQTIRHRMIKLSYQPKLVDGLPQDAGELPISELLEEDLSYLMQWTVRGGDLGLMLNNFPQRREESNGTEFNGEGLGNKTKRANRNK